MSAFKTGSVKIVIKSTPNPCGLYDFRIDNPRRQLISISQPSLLFEANKDTETDMDTDVVMDMDMDMDRVLDLDLDPDKDLNIHNSIAIASILPGGNDMETIPVEYHSLVENLCLLSITENTNTIHIERSRRPDFSLPLSFDDDQHWWKIIHRNEQQSACLREGDIIKVGKSLIEVKLISETKLPISYDSIISKFVKCKESDQASEDSICRICYENNRWYDPLVNICKCSGSVKYCHVSCLIDHNVQRTKKSYFRQESIIHRKPNVLTFINDHFRCELCKVTLPWAVKTTKGIFNLMKVPKESVRSYAVLQVLQRPDKPELRGAYSILSFDNTRQHSIGRSRECSLSVNVAAMSRVHAFLCMDTTQSKLILSDNSSRYGTCVLMNDCKIELGSSLSTPTAIQIGCRVYTFKYDRAMLNVPMKHSMFEIFEPRSEPIPEFRLNKQHKWKPEVSICYAVGNEIGDNSRCHVEMEEGEDDEEEMELQDLKDQNDEVNRSVKNVFSSNTREPFWSLFKL